MSTLRRLSGPGWVILHDPVLLPQPQPQHFEPEAQSRQGAQAAGAGRGAALFVEGPGGQRWVLREYLRGGLPAKLLKRQYAWLGEERTRAFRECRLLQDMHAQGLPVPAPVGVAIWKHPLSWRGAILMQAVPGAESLADLLAQGAFEMERDWPPLRDALRACHRTGYRHADLNARNLLRDQSGAWVLIDWDRGRAGLPPALCRRTLHRLVLSLDKIAKAEGWAAQPLSALRKALQLESTQP